jgi:hypothetical protein
MKSQRLEADSYLKTTVARRTENASSPENTRCTVVPPAFIHLVGKELDSPGPTSQRSVK